MDQKLKTRCAETLAQMMIFYVDVDTIFKEGEWELLDEVNKLINELDPDISWYDGVIKKCKGVSLS